MKAELPPPRTISGSAQEWLELVATHRSEPVERPSLNDKEGWREFLSALDVMLVNRFPEALGPDTEIVAAQLGGVPVFDGRPSDDAAEEPGVIFYLHGGALVMGGGEALRVMTAMHVRSMSRRVIAPDFGNPPDHPYPGAIDDCVAAYRALIVEIDPKRIAVVGASGGGNLAVLLPLKLAAAGLPYPACVAVQSPEVDLTESGDSFALLSGVDPILTQSLKPESMLYAGGRDLADPDISPLYAEFPADYPPTWIQSGTRDLFLSNAVLLHRALRRRAIPAELHVWESMPHGGFGGGTLEDTEVYSELNEFMRRHFVNRA